LLLADEADPNGGSRSPSGSRSVTARGYGDLAVGCWAGRSRDHMCGLPAGLRRAGQAGAT